MSRNEEFVAGQPSGELSDEQRKILDFAGRDFPTPGHREEAILTEFGYRGTTYFRRLNDLLGHPKAMEYAPNVIKRHMATIERGLAARRPGLDMMRDGNP